MPIEYKSRADVPLQHIMATFPHFFQSIGIKLTIKTEMAPDSVVAASTAPFKEPEHPESSSNF